MTTNKHIKAILGATIMAVALAGAAGNASAGRLSAGDPTQGRLNKRIANNNQEYFRCAEFSLKVYKACLDQVGKNSARIRSCRSHYQGNLSRCRQSSY